MSNSFFLNDQKYLMQNIHRVFLHSSCVHRCISIITAIWNSCVSWIYCAVTPFVQSTEKKQWRGEGAASHPAASLSWECKRRTAPCWAWLGGSWSTVARSRCSALPVSVESVNLIIYTNQSGGWMKMFRKDRSHTHLCRYQAGSVVGRCVLHHGLLFGCFFSCFCVWEWEEKWLWKKHPSRVNPCKVLQVLHLWCTQCLSPPLSFSACSDHVQLGDV